MKKISIKEAAQILGISEQAVRKRISRGTLDSVKENGHVYVILEDDSAQKMEREDYEQFFNLFLEEIEKKEIEIKELKEIIKQKEEKIDLLQNEVKEALKENAKLSQGVHIEARKLIETFLPMLEDMRHEPVKKRNKKKKK
ncbi:helix-turn-helix domain-containing protein [Nitrosophilus labii]|uniref:helix-turn-helix domain-containing protein n=1 Tax=Nitrosophilus labii TaxID=2706014 RepID=UPI00165732A2|nr:helix-turn-helix domain-containing protein [Nitrosophilus labii]